MNEIDKSKNIYYAVIVIFNKSINESITLKRLKNVHGYDIRKIIVDNSTINNTCNKELCEVDGYKYINMNGNFGLSKAYNKVLDYLRGDSGIVIWLDDDTNISQEYFDVLDEEINLKKEVAIFTPIIQGQDGKFWSPNEARFFKNKQLKNQYEKINNKYFNAINSCTAVRLNVYKDYRYNENIFLDQVDHNFFYDMRERKLKFEKINVIIKHNFSLKNKNNSIDQIKKRYDIMIPDFIIYSSRNKKMFILGSIKVFGWGVRETIRYKDISFLPWCIKKYCSSIVYLKNLR